MDAQSVYNVFVENHKTESGVYAKLVRAYREIGKIKKTGKNKFHGYEFIEASEVYDRVRDVCSGIGLAIIPEDMRLMDDSSTAKGTKVSRVALNLRVVDVDTGSSFVVSWVGEGMDSEDKGVQKAGTSAMKYALMKLFMIVDDDDPDSGHDAAPVPQKDANVAEFLKAVFDDPETRKDFMGACKNAGVKPMDIGAKAMSKGVSTKDGVMSLIGGDK